MSKSEWQEMGELVCGLLESLYGEQRQECERAARQRGITLEQLAAAAIVGALQQREENGRKEPGHGSERRRDHLRRRRHRP